MRPVVSTEEEARKELDPRLPLVPWLEADLALPFDRLGWDRFEVFCYLLLKREHPGEEIIYYGKTGDSGRDIVRHRKGGAVELIQCKCYGGNVGVGEIRKELAKLFTNLHSGEIPIEPDRVARISFYASPDLTGDAKDLLRYPEKWREVAEKALKEHLGESPSPELLEFALSWWPTEGFRVEMGVDLTQRVRLQPDLRDGFFELKKVIVGTIPDVEDVVRKVMAEDREGRPIGNGFQPGTWGHFFSVAGQENVAVRYLAHWPSLPPDQRFETPAEYPKILESVQEQPLTFLIGPPASGKTFTVVQLLWDAYCRGLHVRWIGPEMPEPTDGPVPAERGRLDMKRRIEALAHRLGLEPFQAPLDAHDFIASNLKPDSLVYIEDPFGKRDDEFGYSLHTYDFFDLDAFVSAIDEGARRANCRIVVSSRNGLFERWMDDRKSKGKGRPKSQLVRIGTKSYSSGQRFDFARKLAEVHGLAKAEDIADEIVSQIRLPYEIEKIILGLPKGANPREAKAAAMSWLGDLREATRRQLSTEDDSERLFLLVAALEGTRSDYLHLYRGMGIPGDGKEVLEAALARYRPFVVRQSLPLFRDGRPVDEKFSPTHSSVQEAITTFLTDHPEWTERVALALSKGDGTDGEIALYLLSLGIGKSGPAQDGIASALFEKKGLGGENLRRFMRLWPALSDSIKDKFFQYLESDPKDIVRGVAAHLERVEMPAHEAWRVLRLLLKERYLLKGGIPAPYLVESHPWRYLVGRFPQIPEDLRSALEALADRNPELFTYALGEVLIEIWSKIPTKFKDAFSHRFSLESDRVQRKILRAIARHWTAVPQELRDFFFRQAISEKPLIRANAARAAWLYWTTNPEIFDPIYMMAVDDPDLSVPLDVLSGSCDDDYTRKFAEKLFVRGDRVVAAYMLQKFLVEGSFSEDEWTVKMMQLCIEKGGELALGVLAAHHFARSLQASPFYVLPEALAKEQEIVRLGALHAYAHAHGERERSYLSEDEAIALVEGMNYPYRDLALYYLSVQVVRLPTKVRAYIENLEGDESEDGEAVRYGKKERQPEKGPWTLFKFPVRWIAAALESQEAHP